jgi:1-deoxy-D-xylulose-5-phosphate reductoisomerase
MSAVLNAANEASVALFLNEKIDFVDIPKIISKIMGKHSVNINPSLNDIIEVDRWAREEVEKNLKIK